MNSKNITKNTFVFGMNVIGKSTMLQIIAGLYNNYEGNIAINNDLVTNLSNESIIYLDQFDYLYAGKVIDNFMDANSTFNYNYFYEHKLDELMNMYKLSLESPIINNGSNLSKGQRQIISFLSLLFIERDIYIIDESLSNVEGKLKTMLLKILLVEKKNKLIIYCDHDMENINLFDDVWEIK
ncbi:ATP-binding cassette domain-containing protein [Spiroplasma endosymbiont of Labia minor]|uniref:ATP-binding cassette domain-containing protein n=1 Tax=Spiroplasma endosymbiont of Labia minor TaxID=3066305 RepID=UPI0030D60FAA